jgi:integrating conjugative element protein (TIGR03746 family)
MAGFTNELDNKRFVIKLQWVFIAILTVLALYAISGWRAAPHEMTVHVPPDLRSGTRVKVGEVPLPNVYAFAYYIWQQVNRWPQDGEKDYGAAIFKMQAFITPSCRQLLETDMTRKSNNGELTLRTRSLQEVPGHGYEDSHVVPLGNSVWKVLLDAEVFETVHGISVKNTAVHYPLRVVRFDADREANPFGLAIDCFDDDDQPARLDLTAERRAMQATNAQKSAAGGDAGRLQNALTTH